VADGRPGWARGQCPGYGAGGQTLSAAKGGHKDKSGGEFFIIVFSLGCCPLFAPVFLKIQPF
jgi:hypothetical protein